MALAQSFALSSKGLSLRPFPPRAWLCDEELGQGTQERGDVAKEAALCSPFGFDNLPCLAVSSFHPENLVLSSAFQQKCVFFSKNLSPLLPQLFPSTFYLPLPPTFLCPLCPRFISYTKYCNSQQVSRQQIARINLPTMTLCPTPTFPDNSSTVTPCYVAEASS